MRTPAEVERAIAITARGVATSLGCDPVTACAAARAGIVGSTELDFELTSPTGDRDKAIGHPARGLTSGFEGFARILRLAQLGLASLEKDATSPAVRSPYRGLYLALPDPLRIFSGLDRIADAEERARRAADAESARVAMDPAEETASRLLHACARALRWTSEPHLRFTTTSGHTGMVEAIAKAFFDLRAGRVSSAVVGAVDSLLDDDTLVWLSQTGRLKGTSAPVGLQPGEASVFLLLEPLDAISRDTRPLAIVRDVHLGMEERTFFSGEPPLGVGLATMLSALAHRGQHGLPPWYIGDHNGEPYRAMDWGHAAIRLRTALPAPYEPEVWYTAASFGDTGAASAGLSMCLAMSAFERGYAPATSTIILSSADGPPRGAAVLAAPGS